MIIKGLFELIFGLLRIIFAPINLPQLPASVQSVVDELSSVLKSSVGLLSVFVDLNVLNVLIPVCIAVANFDKVWKVIMFILRKIPFLGIK